MHVLGISSVSKSINTGLCLVGFGCFLKIGSVSSKEIWNKNNFTSKLVMLGNKKRTRELAIDGVQLTHHRIFEYESLHTGVIHLVHTQNFPKY